MQQTTTEYKQYYYYCAVVCFVLFILVCLSFIVVSFVYPVFIIGHAMISRYVTVNSPAPGLVPPSLHNPDCHYHHQHQ